MFPDGRIVFAKLTQGTDAKGADSRTDWFVAEKDGSDPRKLVSLPGKIGPVWVAPDGQRILIEEDHDGARRITVFKKDWFHKPSLREGGAKKGKCQIG